ncbi:MAG: hypothetical protein L6Q76_11015 [Polyangiaceae bacterium]|nr:hypothetical protein [Polyangiaceae bacterium]
MKGTRLEDLPIKHFEYIFTPTGMPLVPKGEDEHGTTSILVRGGAGTGKTTLALALAHAIAKAGGGLVFYLTTEFSPAEIAFKATLIGLPEEAVDVWPGGKDASVGSIVVEHLSEVRHGRAVLSSAERKKSSIDAVWESLHPESEAARRPSLPVRAVVIDALTLPDAGEDERSLRADLVNFVQALENEGISVVLVEELASETPAWSAFVVDVVLELTFSNDAETQELRRKLTLSKCRYSTSLPGPHDYGLEGESLAVWPDLLRVATGGHNRERLTHIKDPVRVALPSFAHGKWAVLGPGIVMSDIDEASTNVRGVFRHTPGAVEIPFSLGSITYIGAHKRDVQIHDNQGAAAVGWAVLAAGRELGANVCFVQFVERLLSRKGWTTPILHLLEGLRELGFLVCVHAELGSIPQAVHVADFAWDSHGMPSSIPKRRHLWATRFLLSSQSPDTSEQSLLILRSSSTWRSRIETASSSHELNAIIENAASITDSRDKLISPLVQGLAGSNKGRGKIIEVIDSGGFTKTTRTQLAWLALHLGADWHAGREALREIMSDSPEPSMLLLWKAICSAIAGNKAAISELQAILTSPEEIPILDPLLRGLAKTDQFDQADIIIADFVSRHNLSPWMHTRLRAETRLDSEHLAPVRDALPLLVALSEDAAIPLVHRAEIWHNLGVAYDRLGDQKAAGNAFQTALNLNSNLDASREELEALSPKASLSHSAAPPR